MAKRKLLTQEEQTALDAGADPSAVLDGELPGHEEGASEADASTDSESTEVTAEVDTTETLEVVKEDAGLTGYLKTQLAEANEKVLSITLENRQLQSQLDQMKATHAEMRTVVCDLTNNRRKALNSPGMDMSGLSDEAVMQQFNQVTATYISTFPVGGRGKAPDPQPHASVINLPDPNKLAAVRGK